jgi:glycerophosphoryl diester phosphodiesterase
MKIWGHRGAFNYAPENTIQSFQTAALQGADGVELDVQLSYDGEVVVIHDEKVDRTSNGKGFVREFTLKELKDLNFSKGDKKKFVQIPTLREVLEILAPTELKIDIELKTSVFPYNGIEERVLDIVNSFNLNERVLYTSFNHNTLRTLNSIYSNAYVGLLHSKTQLAPEFTAGADSLCPSIGVVRHVPDYVYRAHRMGFKVNVWGIKNREDIEFCMELGVDAIITDDVPFAKKVVSG